MRADQISIITGRIMGLRLVFLYRYRDISPFMADLMVAQSLMLRAWQTSRASRATSRSSSMRLSDSFT